jgi:hypothetical protein
VPSYVAGRDSETVVGGSILSSVSNGAAADGGAFTADVVGSVDANEGFPRRDGRTDVLVAGRAGGAATDRARANGTATTDGGNVADNAVLGPSDGSLALMEVVPMGLAQVEGLLLSIRISSMGILGLLSLLVARIGLQLPLSTTMETPETKTMMV